MSTDSKTLYVGNLPFNVTEQFMVTLFGQLGTCLGCKMIYESGQDPYCFLEFDSHESASSALTTMNGREIFGKQMKVNWATSPNSKNSSEMARGRVDTSDHFHIFCGDLSPDIETKQLLEAFKAFGEISDCKVICDTASGKSKGYGFISFVNKEEAQKAINEMNGAWLGNRAIRTNWATRKPPAPVERARHQKTVPKLTYEETFNMASPTNATVYIGGIMDGINDDMLREAFDKYGPVAEIRCFKDKGFAFVRMMAKEAACQAIVALNGTEVGGYTVRCAWGKESGGMQPSMGYQQQSYGSGYQQQSYGAYPQQQQQMGNWNNYSYGQQWDGSQQQQWSQQQQYGSQWGGGDASNWQQGYQQQGYQQQGYPQQGNYNYSNGGGY